MVNKVFLIGHLTADPDIRATQTGLHIAVMRLATNTYAGRDEDGTRREFTEFHQLVAFGKLAEIAGNYLRKGRLVFVEGRIQTRSWETSEGQTRYMTEIVVDTFQMIGPRREELARAV